MIDSITVLTMTDVQFFGLTGHPFFDYFEKNEFGRHYFQRGQTEETTLQDKKEFSTNV